MVQRIPAPATMPAKQDTNAAEPSTGPCPATRCASVLLACKAGTKNETIGANTMPPIETSSGISKWSKSTKVATINPDSAMTQTNTSQGRSGVPFQAAKNQSTAVKTSTNG